MSSILTIRRLDETVKQKLPLRAARHERSVEAEARAILIRAVEEPPEVEGLGRPDGSSGVAAQT